MHSHTELPILLLNSLPEPFESFPIIEGVGLCYTRIVTATNVCLRAVGAAFSSSVQSVQCDFRSLDPRICSLDLQRLGWRRRAFELALSIVSHTYTGR